MAEQRRSPDLSDEQLAEAEIETDVMDADLEEHAESPAVGAREVAPSTLGEDELAEPRRSPTWARATARGPEVGRAGRAGRDRAGPGGIRTRDRRREDARQ
jgi:hypothetical protein